MSQLKAFVQDFRERLLEYRHGQFNIEMATQGQLLDAVVDCLDQALITAESTEGDTNG